MRDIVEEAAEVLEENSAAYGLLTPEEQEEAAAHYAAVAEVCGIDIKKYDDRPDA